LWRTGNELSRAIRSYEITVQHDHDALLRIGERFENIRKVRPDLPNYYKTVEDKLKGATFSDYRNLFKKLGREKTETTREMLLEVCKTLHGSAMSATLQVANSAAMRSHFMKDFKVFLDPNFEFSEDFSTFEEEFYGIFWLTLCLEESNDPGINYATMKALFQAGKIIERMKYEGRIKNDNSTRGGRAKRKGYIDEQIYFVLFYSTDVGKKSREDVAKKIIKKAKKQEKALAEAREETPKKIKSIRQVKVLLKKELDKIFP